MNASIRIWQCAGDHYSSGGFSHFCRIEIKVSRRGALCHAENHVAGLIAAETDHYISCASSSSTSRLNLCLLFDC
jgi:hypothetical protein